MLNIKEIDSRIYLLFEDFDVEITDIDINLFTNDLIFENE